MITGEPDPRAPRARHRARGPIAWMAQNSIAANLLMLALLVGGGFFATRVTQEVFPAFTIDVISVSVPYPGASPEEVEQGIILAIEDAVSGIDGVRRVSSTASEGRGSVSVELQLGADNDRALQDVKSAVDRIVSFPEEAERPTVSLSQNRRKVVTLTISGDLDEGTLRAIAERVRDELLQKEGITLVELGGVKPLEIAIEVPDSILRTYDLTLDDISREVREYAVELPAGSLKTDGGEVLLRTQERRDFGREFANIPIVARPDGSRVLLGEIAAIHDGFRDDDLVASFDGRPAVSVDIYRVGDQTPISVSSAVKAYLEELRPTLPATIDVSILSDDSEIYADRANLLVRNAAIGLVLVLVLLGLFLEPRLAFWVTLGIPISILGSFLILPYTEASINMISLFAFIVTLGIIVDDAIVVGENIYEKRERGMPALQASIEGAREIATPVIFAVLTNIVAFAPLFFVPGASGKLYLQIPAVAVSVLAISLVESLFILPAHLSHESRDTRFWRIVGTPSRLFGAALQWNIRVLYRPAARFAARERWGTIAIAVALLVVSVAFVVGGHVPFSFLPRIDGDRITVNGRLPVGVPVERTLDVRDRVLARLDDALAEAGEDRSILEGVYAVVGQGGGSFGPIAQTATSGGHLFSVQVEMVPTEARTVGSVEFARIWRTAVGEIPGVETLTFDAQIGRGGGAPIDAELSHRDPAVLDAASLALADELRRLRGLIDVDSGVEAGKPQLDVTLTPQARNLGLSASSVARQLRSFFFGSEALRQQRGRNEVRVMVRLPERDRRTMHTIEELVLRTPSGAEIPMGEAVEIDRGRSYTTISRRDGRRVQSVTADVDDQVIGEDGQVVTANAVVATLEASILPSLAERFPGLSWSFEGEQRDQRESFANLGAGFTLALFVIYGMLAIPFRSYAQPLIVMSAIPFGIVGAIGGHILLGYGISMISIFGIIALSGVVVNDSLVLVVTANRTRAEEPDVPLADVMMHAGARRFRPILLTSLTTFFGLAPMIWETSVQARFLIPMAISLGFGVLFSTFIILLLVPALYVALDDLQRIVRWFATGSTEEDAAETRIDVPDARVAASSSS